MTKLPSPAFVPPWELAGKAPGSGVLLGLSGGADSIVLLDLLAKLQKETPFPLFLAHVDHGIRGEEARRDRAFCQAVAASYGLELCILEADVPADAAACGESLEEAARRIRYDYFQSLMEEHGLSILCTAHHADDHFETLLFRLSRGTGPRGLCGIAPARPFGTGHLVRPILSMTRKDILAYCRENNLQYVTDSTNADPAYARNRIRMEVSPVLEELFPGASRRALQLSARISEDEAYFDEQVEHFFDRYPISHPIPTEALKSLPRPILRRALTAYVGEYAATPEYNHIEELLRLIDLAAPHMRVALPGGMYACVTNGALTLTADRMDSATADYCIPFGEGEFTIPMSDLRMKVESLEKPIKIHNLSIPPYINLIPAFDIIAKDAVWRPMAPGDRILIRGMHRRLRRLYADLGVSVKERHTLPLLWMGEHILFAPGIGLADGYAIAPDAPCCLVKIERPPIS